MWFEGQARRVLILLVSIDVAFVVLDIAVRVAGVSEPGRLLVTTDRGYAEAFQYLKILGIAVLLGVIASRTRELVFYVWTVIFGYLLVDDLLRIHETVGGEFLGDVLENLPLAAGGNVYKLGQILFSVVVAGLVLGAILVSSRFSSQVARRTSNTLLVLLVVFAFFSLVLDAVGTWLDFAGRPTVEDGGEMFAMSLIAGFVFSLYSKGELTASPRGESISA